MEQVFEFLNNDEVNSLLLHGALVKFSTQCAIRHEKLNEGGGSKIGSNKVNAPPHTFSGKTKGDEKFTFIFEPRDKNY